MKSNHCEPPLSLNYPDRFDCDPFDYLENWETTLTGSVREASEEADARVRVLQNTLCTLFNLPAVKHVYLLFRAGLEDLDCNLCVSLEVDLSTETHKPSDQISISVVRITLEHRVNLIEQNKKLVEILQA